MSLVTVVSCQLEVSSTGRSLIQSRPTERGASLCGLDASTVRCLSPSRAVASQRGKSFIARK